MSRNADFRKMDVWRIWFVALILCRIVNSDRTKEEINLRKRGEAVEGTWANLIGLEWGAN